MTTPTLEDLSKKIDEVEAKNKALSDENSKLKSQPDFSGVRYDDQGRLKSYWQEDDSEPITVVTGRDDLDGPRAARISSRKSLRKLIKGGYEPWGEFKSFNDLVRSGLDGHKTQAFADRVSKHYKAIQGMSEQVGADGGFSVMPEFSNKIFERLYANDLFNRTDNYTVGGGGMTFIASAETSRKNGSRAGGIQGYWTGEGGSITSSKPTVREIQMKLQKVAVVVYLTDELIADTGLALEQYVTRVAAEELNFKIGDALINGDGVGKPLGMLSAPSLLAISQDSGQAAATITATNVINMQNRFFMPFYDNAIWLAHQTALAQLPQLTLATGTYSGALVYMPPTGLSEKPYSTLQGRPVVPSEFCQTLGTQGDLILADPRQMISISKGGITQAVSMHVEFLTDQLALRFTLRMNAMPWENAPITPFNGNTTQSSFVTIPTRHGGGT